MKTKPKTALIPRETLAITQAKRLTARYQALGRPVPPRLRHLVYNKS